MDAITETAVKTVTVIKGDDVVNESNSNSNTNSKIYIHEDHDFKAHPETVYFCNGGVQEPIELGKFVHNQKKWNAGIQGWGDGECKFTKRKFNRECPYSSVYYYGVKETPGTTIGPEYEFDKHPKDRVYYRIDRKGRTITLGRVLDHGYPYDAGFHGMSYGFTIFEFDKESFRGGDCRIMLPVKYKIYFLE